MKRFIICLIFILSESGCNIVHAETKLIRQRLTDTDFYISIPPDFNMNRVEGSDFVIYYFNPVDTVSTDTFSFGLYFGNYPSNFKQIVQNCNKEAFDAFFLTKVCKWDIYNCNDNYLIQTIIENENINVDKEFIIMRSDEKIHAFGNSKKKEDINFILEIFSTFAKEDK